MVVFEKTKGLKENVFHYCPGCTHGIAHRLVGEVLVELELLDEAIGIAPVGCAVFAYNYFNCDVIQAPHGRAPAVATGVKRADPSKTVFTYQGDGDLAAIGTAETVHAGTRGENITIIFINNTIYGMTSGQMAPTSLLGQKTTTSPYGRKAEIQGYPIKVCEMMATLEGVAYAERVSVDSVKNVISAKRAIKKAFTLQKQNAGLTIIEILSTCPTNWGLSPEKSIERLREEMIPYFPLGVYKDKTKGGEQ